MSSNNTQIMAAEAAFPPLGDPTPSPGVIGGQRKKKGWKKSQNQMCQSSKIDQLKHSDQLSWESFPREANRIRAKAYETINDKEKLSVRLRCTTMCRSVARGVKCHLGDRCTFAHSLDELKVADCAFGSECNRVHYTDDQWKNKTGSPMCKRCHPGESKENYASRTGTSDKPALGAGAGSVTRITPPMVPRQVKINRPRSADPMQRGWTPRAVQKKAAEAEAEAAKKVKLLEEERTERARVESIKSQQEYEDRVRKEAAPPPAIGVPLEPEQHFIVNGLSLPKSIALKCIEDAIKSGKTSFQIDIN